MPTQQSLEQKEFSELAQSVDNGRTAADPFTLPAGLRTLLDNRLIAFNAAEAVTGTTEGQRFTAQGIVRTALDQLLTLLRDGYNFIQALPSYTITEAERIGIYTSYGWQSGLVGDFTDARIEALANQALAATPSIANTAHRYPAPLLALITTQLGLVNANQPIATGGAAQAATDDRDVALALLILINSRVRFFYCSASDDLDQTPELVKIGRQPRRDPGSAEPQPLPDVPGPATFNAADLTLSVAQMPLHATSLHAFRQPAGGPAELCGTSLTTTVSVVGIGPLTPGVNYQFWLAGFNSRGAGPESNHVLHSVSIGPGGP